MLRIIALTLALAHVAPLWSVAVCTEARTHEECADASHEPASQPVDNDDRKPGASGDESCCVPACPNTRICASGIAALIVRPVTPPAATAGQGAVAATVTAIPSPLSAALFHPPKA